MKQKFYPDQKGGRVGRGGYLPYWDHFQRRDSHKQIMFIVIQFYFFGGKNGPEIVLLIPIMCGTGTKIALIFIFILKSQNWGFFVKVKNRRTLDLNKSGCVFWGVLIQAFFFF